MKRLVITVVSFLCGATLAWADTASVKVPTNRLLEATEPMAAPGNSGIDGSVNPPSLGGLTLLKTIAAPTTPRSRIEIMPSCTEGASVVVDDQAAALTATIYPISGPATAGGQGGEWVTSTHTGRIRVYSSNANCQVAIRVW